MKRLAIGLAALLSGCIFLTPPTGLRIGDHSQEFANVVQQTTTIDPEKVEYGTYDAPDFSVKYWKDWGEPTGNNDMSKPYTQRLSAGVRFTTGGSEGLIVTTINQMDFKDPAGDLAVFVKGNLSQDAQNFELVAEKTAPVGGEDARFIEAKVKDKNGLDNHVLAWSVVHEKRGWVIVITTLESRYAALAGVFQKMMDAWTWKTGTAASAAPGASASPTASTSPAPSGSMPPSPSPMAGSPAPSPSASAQK